MRNFSSVVPSTSVYRISASAFSEDRLTFLLAIIVNRAFERGDDFDWDFWTPSEARVISQLEDWVSDCRGKTIRNLPLNMAFSYSNCNTGKTVLFIWDDCDSILGLTENVSSLYYRVNPNF